MNPHLLLSMTLFVNILLCFSSVKAGKAQPIQDFRLIDQNDHSHSLYYNSNAKFIFLLRLDPNCDLSQSAISLLRQMKEKVRNDNSKMFLISATPHNRSQQKDWLKQFNETLPLLNDDLGLISKELQLNNNGSFVKIETKTWKLLSTGSLKDVSFEKCSAINSSPSKYSYRKDVAPLIIRHCLKCHGERSPWGNFAGYKQILGWSAMIKQTIRTHRMPPGGRDPYYGNFKDNFNYLSLNKIVAWINDGAQRGVGPDPLKKNSSKKRQNDNLFGKRKVLNGQPNLTLKMKKAHHVPEEGLLEYQYVDLMGPTETDLFIEAVHFKVNTRVTHHTNLLILDKPVAQTKHYHSRETDKVKLLSGSLDSHKESMNDERTLLTSRRYNDEPIVLPKDLAFYIPKGKYIALEFHYNPTGIPEKNLAEVDLYFKKGGPYKILKRLRTPAKNFVILPDQKSKVVEFKVDVAKDIHILAFQPHMHRRGSAVKYKIVDPNQHQNVILNVPYFQFNFQRTHELQDPFTVLKGSKIIAEFTFDNSKENPSNPDHLAKVSNGLMTTTDEMAYMRVFYYEDQ